MSEVITFKVPRYLKEKMKKLRDKVNWSEELRLFLIKKIGEIEAEEALKEAIKIIKRTKGAPKGFAIKSVREDRDSS